MLRYLPPLFREPVPEHARGLMRYGKRKVRDRSANVRACPSRESGC